MGRSTDHGVGVRDERRGDEVELDCGGIGGREGDGEGSAIRQSGGAGYDGGPVAGDVRRDEALYAELGGEFARERVELVRVGAGDDDRSIGDKIGGGVVHARDSGAREGGEARARGVVRLVQIGRGHSIAGAAPPLRTVGRAVDDEHVARGEQHHVAHGARLRQVLHRPPRPSRQGRHSSAGLGRRRGRIAAQVRPVLRAPTHQHLRIVEPPAQRQQHGAPGRRVVAGLPGDGGEIGRHRVGLPVVQARVTVGEDPKLIVRHQVHKRVQVVVLRVVRLQSGGPISTCNRHHRQD